MTTLGGARFLVLDGIDGCGKSTQARMLAEALTHSRGVPALHLREPGGTKVGERIRELLLSREHELDAGVELLLFAAARRQTLRELVRPALAAGRDVVCERFHASTFAYQAIASGLPEDHVLSVLLRWADDPRPDTLILLDIDPDEAARRRAGFEDRIEAKGLEFQRRVAEGYRRFARLQPDTIVIDGSARADEVARAVRVAVGLGG
ncbi:MAG: dTMP kinase [Planctomycetes bacterium]|nr:dTMP kinase [Planctomycetota bacterium]